MRIYRIGVKMIETGYVDVSAKNQREALQKAEEECNSGDFVGNNSYAEIGRVIEVR